MKIGIVNLDTSHPPSWIPLERKLGHEIVGVWDSGAIHPPEYVAKFAKEHSIPCVFDSLDAMAREVDCAVVHSCDWDVHVSAARPFIQQNRSVFIDKPLAGNLADLRQLAEWAKQGARITGGSAFRYCFELVEWMELPVSERGTPHTAFAGVAVDEYNYGIHAYTLLSAIFGPGLKSARHLGSNTQRRIELRWADGRAGIVIVGAIKSWIPAYTTIVTELKAVQIQPDAHRLYEAIVSKAFPFLAGETDEPPVPFPILIEAELAALAARESWMNGDREIFVDKISPGTRYEGASFAAAYRKAKYG